MALHVVVATASAALLFSPHGCRSPATPLPARTSVLSAEECNPGAVAGTDLRIIEYPHPLLRAPNAEVVAFDDSLVALSREMFAIMYAAEGVGLAAPQLGVSKRLMVFNSAGDPEEAQLETVLANPRIVDASAAVELDVEGCLSFPGFTADVERAQTIIVEYCDLSGAARRATYAGWEARIFQHEYDHLDGLVYVDRLSAEERRRVQPHLDELVARHGPGGALDPGPEQLARLGPLPAPASGTPPAAVEPAPPTASKGFGGGVAEARGKRRGGKSAKARKKR